MKGLRQLLRQYERDIVVTTLKKHGGDKAKTAKALQISRRTLDKIMERHRLGARRYARPLPIPFGRSDDDREA